MKHDAPQRNKAIRVSHENRDHDQLDELIDSISREYDVSAGSVSLSGRYQLDFSHELQIMLALLKDIVCSAYLGTIWS